MSTSGSKLSRALFALAFAALAVVPASGAAAATRSSERAALENAVIAAQSSATYICPTNTCVTIPVTITRTGTTPVRGVSVTFTLSGNLSLCAGTASITEGTFLSNGPRATSFQIIDNGGGSYTADGATLGTDCGPAELSGLLFNIGVTSSDPGGTGTISVSTVKLRDCLNNDLDVTAGPDATVPIDNQAPSVSVISPNGGESWVVGSSQKISWSAADNTGVASIDLSYSTDGGATYPNVIATGLPNTGTYTWSVPNTVTTQARVKATAHDVVCSSADDASDADFTIRDPEITAIQAPNGSIAPAGTTTVPNGTDIKYSITPDTKCYSVADVIVDGVSVGATGSYTFVGVTVDHTITASFALNTYSIVAHDAPGGTITPAGKSIVNCGDSQTYTIAPAGKCNFITDVIVDGVSQGPISTYTFTDVQSNHDIAPVFSTNGPFTITASAGPNGAISPSGSVTALCGANKTFTITPNKCFLISDVLVDGVSVGAVSTYTFLDVQANHDIKALFTANPVTYTITSSANPGGSIDPNGTVTVGCDGVQSYTITPDPCYQILDVLVDGHSMGTAASYTFSQVQANHTIEASFSPTLSLAISNASVNEGNHGTVEMVFTVTLSGPCVNKISVDWATQDFQATVADNDYVPGSGTLSFAPGETSQTISVTINGDIANEGYEIFYVNLSNAVGANIGRQRGTGVINNDDLGPQVHVITPNGGESINVGSPTNIFWTATGDVGKGVLLVDIFESKDNGANYHQIAANEANDGVFSWTPGAGDATNTGIAQVFSGLIKVIAHDADGKTGQDVSNHPFSVFRGPQVVVTSPNGGEHLLANDPHNPYKVSWTATDAASKGTVLIDIFESTNNGGTYHPVALNEANDGTYTWFPGTDDATNTGNDEVFSALIKIVAHDAAGKTGEDVSDNPFSVFDGAIDALISEFAATPINDGVEVRWQVAQPAFFTNIGLERSSTQVGPWTAVSGSTRLDGNVTVVVDRSAAAGQTYYYRLVGTTTSGEVMTFGPQTVTLNAAVAEFAIKAIAPNPTKNSARIDYTVGKSTNVRLSVVDLQGRTVAVLTDGTMSPGRYQAVWNATSGGSKVPAGLYFVRYQAAGNVFVKRVAVTE